MTTNEERAAARKAHEDARLADLREAQAKIKARRLEILDELERSITQRVKVAEEAEQMRREYDDYVRALIEEGRDIGVPMNEMQHALGWKSRQSVYNVMER